MTAFNTPAGLALNPEAQVLGRPDELRAVPNHVIIHWGQPQGSVPAANVLGEAVPVAEPVEPGEGGGTPALPTTGLLWPRV